MVVLPTGCIRESPADSHLHCWFTSTKVDTCPLEHVSTTHHIPNMCMPNLGDVEVRKEELEKKQHEESFLPGSETKDLKGW